MFPGAYFPPSYFPAAYFPGAGGIRVPVIPDVRVRFREDVGRVLFKADVETVRFKRDEVELP